MEKGSKFRKEEKGGFFKLPPSEKFCEYFGDTAKHLETGVGLPNTELWIFYFYFLGTKSVWPEGNFIYIYRFLYFCRSAL